MDRITLNIQRFADGKVVIDTALNTKNFENGLDRMKSTTQKAGSTIKNIVVGLGITKLISAGINQINSSLDGAIARYDTLNNFPKVMSNLGIASDEAQKSIDKMSDKLSGLPTTLDQGAMAVQRFASANGNVEKSTDIFLALNNAILAGGASTEIQASALEQLSQSYAKGKPDMMEWRTAMTAMPAQLKQVATAMGYVDADALGEALRTGKVSMDEFMDTIVKLNTEGLEGFENFETQARNSTGGIATSIQVAKTQVVKGVTDIIEALNVKLQELGIGSISDIISDIGKKAKNGLDMIAKLIKGELSLGDFTSLGLQLIERFVLGMVNNLPKVLETATSIISSVGTALSSEFPIIVNQILENLPMILNLASQFITQLIQGISNNLPMILDSATAIITSLTTSITENLPQLLEIGMQALLTLVKGISNNLPTLIPQVIDIIDTIVETLIDNIDLIIDGALELIIGLADGLIKALPFIIDKVPVIIDKLVTKLTDPEMLGKIIQVGAMLITQLAIALVMSIPSLLNGVKKINDSIIKGLKNITSAIGDIGTNIVKGIWSGISNSLGWIKSKIKGWVGDVVKFMKKLFGIHSPSTVMRDEVGKYLAQGMGVGFDDELDSVYSDMQKAINFENAKIQSNVESGKIFNSLVNSTPITISLDASVDMDSQKVGRLVTPSVARTIKNGGVY